MRTAILLFLLTLVALVAALQRGPRPASALGGPAVTGGSGHTCALTSARGVKCWGRNDFGQLGDGTTTQSTTPVDVCATGATAPCSAGNGNLLTDVTAVSAGPTHTCALTAQGLVKCWGDNTDGRLGDGTTSARNTPVDVCASGATTPCSFSLLTGVAAVAAGNYALGHTCVLTTAGGVKCWGTNTRGQLGDGTQTPRLTPVEVCAPGATAPCSTASGNVLTGAVGVDAGYEHTCALTKEGGVRCWGYGSDGRLGNGLTTEHHTPVDVCATGATAPCSAANGNLLTGVAVVVAAYSHNCAVGTAGGVKCWGSNLFGRLGDGTTVAGRFTPVDVCATGATAPCSEANGNLLTGTVGVDAGSFHTCALTKVGGVKCWGNGSGGQLGDGTLTTSRYTPADVCATGATAPCSPANGNLLTGAAGIGTGDYQSCAVTTVGGVKCWGYNNAARLGDGTLSDRSTPVDVCATGATPPCTEAAGNILTGVPLDRDGDGCTDLQEAGGSPLAGGRRNPKSFWDFFDVPSGVPAARDRRVTIGDIVAVVARFGSAGDPGATKAAQQANALSSPPPAPPAYHPAFDRTASVDPSQPWRTGPPSGQVSIVDISLAVGQFGHTCAF